MLQMKVGIYFNKNYMSDNRLLVEKIVNEFTAKGASCKIVQNFNDLDGLEILFVLGGDGTILLVAAECAIRGIKIIGINYGHMGFLAEFEPEKLDDALALVCGGQYKTEKRTMLAVNSCGVTYLALNDVVIQRSTCGESFANTVNIHAEIDGTTVDNFSSDGIIISTPTGSTAYSLAAGGSVLAPELNAFELTPICAHSLHSRPIVYSDKSILKISNVNVRVPLILNVDGKVVGEICNGQQVTIAKAEHSVEFITAGDKNFFNKLLIKLNIWSK